MAEYMNRQVGSPVRMVVLSVLVMLTAACTTMTPYPGRQLQQAGMLTPEEISARYRVDTQWWRIYGDKELDRLVDAALANNLDLRKAALTAENARYAANETGAGLFPEASGSLGGSVRKDVRHGGASSRSFSSSVGLSYELDLWQRVRASADASAWEYRATLEDREITRLSLVNSVADAYFKLAYVTEALELAQKNTDRYREIARIAKARYTAGKTASIEYTQAEQSLLSAENSRISLQQSRAELEETLRNLLNLRPGDPFDIRPVRLAELPDTGIDTDVPLEVLSNRPDLRASEYRLQKYYASLQAARRSWYPSITLGAAVSSSSDRASGLFNIPLGAGTVSVNLPFLNWPTLYWQNKQAEASFDSAKLDFEQTLTTALNEVGRYYRQYALSRSTWQNTEKKYRFDQKNSRYYEIRYRHGAENFSDWLAALNTEMTSAQTRLNDRYTVLQNELLVYQAMAGRYRPVGEDQITGSPEK